MSIHLATAEQVTPGGFALLAVLSAVAILILCVIGFFSSRDELSLRKLSPGARVGPLMMNAGIAVATYFGASILIGVVLRVVDPEAASKISKDGLPPSLLIVFSLVLPLASLAWMLCGLKVVVPGGFRQIGIDQPPQPSNALTALGVLVAILPLMFLVGNLSEWIYQQIGYQHEQAHELLTSMSAVDSGWKKIAAILSAVVLAPLNEELLFRGHLQSGFRRLFLLRPEVLVPEVMAVAVDPSLMPPPLPTADDRAVSPPPLPYQSVPIAPQVEPEPLQAGFRSWLASAAAIVLTSALFALMHPVWSWPMIFTLSLFLGVLYERKGNLWTSIFLHGLFNGTMITLYLSLPTQAH